MEKTKKTCLMSVKVTYPVSLNQMAYMFLVPSDSVAFPDSSCPQIPLHLSGPGNLCGGKKQDIKMGVLIYPPLVVPAEVRNEFTVPSGYQVWEVLAPHMEKLPLVRTKSCLSGDLVWQ